MNNYDETHLISYTKLAIILVILLVLTAITVTVSRIDLGALNIWVALIVAWIKTSFVLLYFMHLRYESRILAGTFILTLCFLAIFIGFVFWDVAYRWE